MIVRTRADLYKAFLRYKVAVTLSQSKEPLNVNKIKLDQGKLLGFKILPQTPKIGRKPPPGISAGTTNGEKIGGKLGVKLGVKLGAKVGGKGPPP